MSFESHGRICAPTVLIFLPALHAAGMSPVEKGTPVTYGAPAFGRVTFTTFAERPYVLAGELSTDLFKMSSRVNISRLSFEGREPRRRSGDIKSRATPK